MGHTLEPAQERHLRIYHLTCSDPVNCGEDCPAEFTEYPVSSMELVLRTVRMQNDGLQNSVNPFEQYIVVDERGKKINL